MSNLGASLCRRGSLRSRCLNDVNGRSHLAMLSSVESSQFTPASAYSLLGCRVDHAWRLLHNMSKVVTLASSMKE